MTNECTKYPGRLRDLCEGKGRDGRPDPPCYAVDAFRTSEGLSRLAEGSHYEVDAALPPIEPPPLIVRGVNFAMAMARWAAAGLPRRSQAEIDERLAICQSCEFYANHVCSRCGCACVEQNQVINKLALATEKCPEGRWS